MEDTIDLVEKKQFRIMLNPVRQEMVHLLRLVARPLSANRVAERMQLSPSAAHAHLNKLVKMGLVSAQEGTRRDGSKTTYYQMRNVKLRLCLGRKDAFQGEREALAANLVDSTFRSILENVYRYDEPEVRNYSVLRFGALHLDTAQRMELTQLVEQYLEEHGALRPEAEEHWEYVVLAYRAGEEL
ncbi:transcriptional regulator [uncultured Flavonifractor sp.]|uniref:helix-turn-helix domain-containing protein n=1 Tax=uncultured Flavonifractor sp. TaxID=1193534 RepID=UPI00261249D1|nr:transcriptional regulator [uncultured Flavonifractor sp.]